MLTQAGERVEDRGLKGGEKLNLSLAQSGNCILSKLVDVFCPNWLMGTNSSANHFRKGTWRIDPL